MKKLLAVIICTMLMLVTACEQKDNNELPDEIPENNVEIEQENKTDVETENKADVETEDTTEDIRPDELPQELIDVYGDCLLNPEEDNYGYIRLSFDDERETSGLYPVRIWVDEAQRDLSGFINSNGKLVVEPKYKHASASSCGYALVCIDNSKHQKDYYDFLGNKFEDKDNYIYTYINEKGEECFGYFDDASSFSEDGLAEVQDKESNRYIIDTDGNIVAKLDEMSYPYNGFGSCDLAPVWSGKHKNYGYMNKKGEFVIEPVFMAAHKFYDGLAAVSHDNTLKYINYDGEIVIDTGIKEGHRLMDPYYVAEPNCDFSDGIARLTPGKYMDVNGNILPNLENGYGMYKEGLISVFDSEQKMGYADITGETVIPCEYRLARDFENGLALVFTYDELPYYDTDVLRDYFEEELNCYYYGYIDKNGDFVIPPEYHIPFYYSEEHPSSMDGAGVIEVYKEGYKYYYNYDGTLIGKNLDVYVEYYYKDQLCYPLNSSKYYEWKKAK